MWLRITVWNSRVWFSSVKATPWIMMKNTICKRFRRCWHAGPNLSSIICHSSRLVFLTNPLAYTVLLVTKCGIDFSLAVPLGQSAFRTFFILDIFCVQLQILFMLKFRTDLEQILFMLKDFSLKCWTSIHICQTLISKSNPFL